MSRKHPAPLLALSTSQAGKLIPLGQGEVPSDTSCGWYHICIECASRAGTGDRSRNAGLEAFAGPDGTMTSSRRRLLSAMHLGGLTFREVCLRTWTKINEHEILTRAAAISF